jgi:hypothetical protein
VEVGSVETNVKHIMLSGTHEDIFTRTQSFCCGVNNPSTVSVWRLLQPRHNSLKCEVLPSYVSALSHTSSIRFD